MIRDAQGGKASRHACAALSATTFHDMRLRRLTTINHALRSYIYRSAVRSMCPDPPADLPSAYPHLAFTRKTTNLPLCGRTHHPLEATTPRPPMRRTAGIKNKIRTRVVRREKSSDSLTPYYESGFYYAHRHRHRRPATAAPSRETVGSSVDVPLPGASANHSAVTARHTTATRKHELAAVNTNPGQGGKHELGAVNTNSGRRRPRAPKSPTRRER